MFTYRKCLAVLLIATFLVIPAISKGAGYPSKTITFLVPYSAGGSTDISSRLIADLASEMLGVQVQVINKPGAGGTLCIGALAKAQSDGYTVGAVTASPIIIRPHTMKTTYNPAKDLTYIARYLVAPAPLSVRADSSWNSFQDLLKYAKENPRKMRWTAGSPKGAAHLALEMAFQKEGIQATYVPYKGGAPGMAALLGKHIDAAAVSEYAPTLEAGETKILVETGPDRLAPIPEIPTLKELGYPLAPTIFYGIAGPAGLPDEVVKIWEDTMAKIVETPKYKEMMNRLKTVPSFARHDVFTKQCVKDHRLMGEALKKIQ